MNNRAPFVAVAMNVGVRRRWAWDRNSSTSRPARPSAVRTDSTFTSRRGAPKITSASDPAAAPTATIIRLRTGTSVDDRIRADMTNTMKTQPVRRHDRVIHGAADDEPRRQHRQVRGRRVLAPDEPRVDLLEPQLVEGHALLGHSREERHRTGGDHRCQHHQQAQLPVARSEQHEHGDERHERREQSGRVRPGR